MEYCAVVGHQCPFAHGSEELRNPAPFGLIVTPPEDIRQMQQLLHRPAASDPEIDRFKIELCPEACCRLKPCTHFHNAYDRRRDPALYAYASTPCKHVFDPARRKYGNPNSCPLGDSWEPQGALGCR